MKDDDEAWSQALAGRPPANMDAASATEARLLRAGLLGAEEPQPAPLSEEQRQRLLQAVRAAAGPGPQGQPWCAGCARRWRALQQALRGPRGRGWPLAGAATAMLAALAVTAVWQLGPLGQPTEPVFRGPAATGTVVRTVADPLAQRQALAAELAATGATVRRYERLGRQGLEAQWPLPLPASATQALQAQGLAADAEGLVRVEFAAAP
jgi:hypothetical protein